MFHFFIQMKSFVFKLYQIIVLFPYIAISTSVIFGTVSLLCLFFNKDKVMYPMSVFWGKSIVYMSLLPVSVKGLEKLDPRQQYIYVGNHTSYYDVFLLSGFLSFPRRWMMKRSLERIPFFGSGCRHAGFVYVDKDSMSAVKATYHRALSALKEGVSMIIFPEGRRSDDGRIAKFSRTPFTLALEMQIPVVPITINGAYDVLPRTRHFLERHSLELIIHDPVFPDNHSNNDVRSMSQLVYDSINSGLNPKYQ